MNNNNDPTIGSRGTEDRSTKARAILKAAHESPGKVKEIDETRATIQTAFQARIPHMKNNE